MSLKTETPERDAPPEHTLLCAVLKSFLEDARLISGRKGPEFARGRLEQLISHAQSKWVGHVCDLIDVNQERLVGLIRETGELRLNQLKGKRYGRIRL